MQQHFDVIQKQQALFEEQKKAKEALILQLKKEIQEQKPKLVRVMKQVCVFIDENFIVRVSSVGYLCGLNCVALT